MDSCLGRGGTRPARRSRIRPAFPTPRPSYTYLNPNSGSIESKRQALRLYDALGRGETVDFYNSMDSVDGPWYVAIYDEDTNTIAHPLRKDFLGTSPRDRSDVNGKPYGLEVVAATEEGRWVDYVFVNPDSSETEQKHTWVIKYDGLLFLSGWYEPAN